MTTSRPAHERQPRGAPGENRRVFRKSDIFSFAHALGKDEMPHHPARKMVHLTSSLLLIVWLVGCGARSERSAHGAPLACTGKGWTRLSAAASRALLTQNQVQGAFTQLAGCSQSVFFSQLRVVRFRSTTPPTVEGWSGAADPPALGLRWLSSQPWSKVSVPAQVVQHSHSERDGNFTDRELIYCPTDAIYWFVFSYSG